MRSPNSQNSRRANRRRYPVSIDICAGHDKSLVNARLPTTPGNYKQYDVVIRYSPLEAAVEAGQLEVVDLLLGCGVDVNLRGGWMTALQHAVSGGNVEMTC